MSRSYREPWFVDSYGSKSKKFDKRHANRKIRNADDVPNGRAYRKYYDPWNIADYKFRWNPYPSIRFRSGEQKIIEAIPEWKARRK